MRDNIEIEMVRVRNEGSDADHSRLERLWLDVVHNLHAAARQLLPLDLDSEVKWSETSEMSTFMRPGTSDSAFCIACLSCMMLLRAAGLVTRSCICGTVSASPCMSHRTGDGPSRAPAGQRCA